MVFKLNVQEILERAKEARKLSSSCRLCPRKCGVNRTTREKGYCLTGAEISIASIVPHFGEEPPISGNGGAGTIFFAHCNMRCVYCQNHQISQGPIGFISAPEFLAGKMLGLQTRGCANIEPVSPSHQLPGFLEALALAVDQGLDLPVVFNSNGYESPETLDLLDGIVSVYLPDLKYADPRAAEKYSDALDYVDVARAAIQRMYAQVGNLVVDMQGAALNGLIIRHLVLPGDVSGTEETLKWIRDNLSLNVTLSIMSQYSPLHKANNYKEINRAISKEEYNRAVDLAWDLGFENVYIQELESPESGIPDFRLDNPFNWCEREKQTPIDKYGPER